MPIDKSSNEYRIRRLENQIMILQKNMLFALQAMNDLIEAVESRHPEESISLYPIITTCIKELKQVTPYQPK